MRGRVVTAKRQKFGSSAARQQQLQQHYVFTELLNFRAAELLPFFAVTTPLRIHASIHLF